MLVDPSHEVAPVGSSSKPIDYSLTGSSHGVSVSSRPHVVSTALDAPQGAPSVSALASPASASASSPVSVMPSGLSTSPALPSAAVSAVRPLQHVLDAIGSVVRSMSAPLARYFDAHFKSIECDPKLFYETLMRLEPSDPPPVREIKKGFNLLLRLDLLLKTLPSKKDRNPLLTLVDAMVDHYELIGECAAFDWAWFGGFFALANDHWLLALEQTARFQHPDALIPPLRAQGTFASAITGVAYSKWLPESSDLEESPGLPAMRFIREMIFDRGANAEPRSGLLAFFDCCERFQRKMLEHVPELGAPQLQDTQEHHHFSEPIFSHDALDTEKTAHLKSCYNLAALIKNILKILHHCENGVHLAAQHATLHDYYRRLIAEFDYLNTATFSEQFRRLLLDFNEMSSDFCVYLESLELQYGLKPLTIIRFFEPSFERLAGLIQQIDPQAASYPYVHQRQSALLLKKEALKSALAALDREFPQSSDDLQKTERLWDDLVLPILRGDILNPKHSFRVCAEIPGFPHEKILKTHPKTRLKILWEEGYTFFKDDYAKHLCDRIRQEESSAEKNARGWWPSFWGLSADLPTEAVCRVKILFLRELRDRFPSDSLPYHALTETLCTWLDTFAYVYPALLGLVGRAYHDRRASYDVDVLHRLIHPDQTHAFSLSRLVRDTKAIGKAFWLCDRLTCHALRRYLNDLRDPQEDASHSVMRIEAVRAVSVASEALGSLVSSEDWQRMRTYISETKGQLKRDPAIFSWYTLRLEWALSILETGTCPPLDDRRASLALEQSLVDAAFKSLPVQGVFLAPSSSIRASYPQGSTFPTASTSVDRTFQQLYLMILDVWAHHALPSHRALLLFDFFHRNIQVWTNDDVVWLKSFLSTHEVFPADLQSAWMRCLSDLDPLRNRTRRMENLAIKSQQCLVQAHVLVRQRSLEDHFRAADGSPLPVERLKKPQLKALCDAVERTLEPSSPLRESFSLLTHMKAPRGQQVEQGQYLDCDRLLYFQALALCFQGHALGQQALALILERYPDDSDWRSDPILMELARVWSPGSGPVHLNLQRSIPEHLKHATSVPEVAFLTRQACTMLRVLPDMAQLTAQTVAEFQRMQQNASLRNTILEALLMRFPCYFRYAKYAERVLGPSPWLKPAKALGYVGYVQRMVIPVLGPQASEGVTQALIPQFSWKGLLAQLPEGLASCLEPEGISGKIAQGLEKHFKQRTKQLLSHHLAQAWTAPTVTGGLPLARDLLKIEPQSTELCLSQLQLYQGQARKVLHSTFGGAFGSESPAQGHVIRWLNWFGTLDEALIHPQHLSRKWVPYGNLKAFVSDPSREYLTWQNFVIWLSALRQALVQVLPQKDHPKTVILGLDSNTGIALYTLNDLELQEKSIKASVNCIDLVAQVSAIVPSIWVHLSWPVTQRLITEIFYQLDSIYPIAMAEKLLEHSVDRLPVALKIYTQAYLQMRDADRDLRVLLLQLSRESFRLGLHPRWVKEYSSGLTTSLATLSGLWAAAELRFVPQMKQIEDAIQEEVSSRPIQMPQHPPVALHSELEAPQEASEQASHPLPLRLVLLPIQGALSFFIAGVTAVLYRFISWVGIFLSEINERYHHMCQSARSNLGLSKIEASP